MASDKDKLLEKIYFRICGGCYELLTRAAGVRGTDRDCHQRCMQEAEISDSISDD